MPRFIGRILHGFIGTRSQKYIFPIRKIVRYTSTNNFQDLLSPTRSCRGAPSLLSIIPSKVNSLRNYRRQVSKEINIKRKARSDGEKEKRKKKEEGRRTRDGEKVGSRSCSRFDRDADLIEPGRKINNGPFCFPRGNKKKRPFVKLFQ